MKAPRHLKTQNLLIVAVALFAISACQEDLHLEPTAQAATNAFYIDHESSMIDSSDMVRTAKWDPSMEDVTTRATKPTKRHFTMENDGCTQSSLVLQDDDYTLVVITHPGRTDLLSLDNFGGLGKRITAVVTGRTLLLPRQKVSIGDRTLTIQGRGNFDSEHIYFSYVLSEPATNSDQMNQTICSTQGVELQGPGTDSH